MIARRRCAGIGNIPLLRPEQFLSCFQIPGLQPFGLAPGYWQWRRWRQISADSRQGTYFPGCQKEDELLKVN